MLKVRWTIRFTVLTVFVFANLLIAAVAIGLQYHFSKSMATETSLNYFNKTANQTRDYIEHNESRAIESVNSLANYPYLLQEQWVGETTPHLFAQTMQSNPAFYAAYIAFENGNFYELINLNSSLAVRTGLNASPKDRWVTITVLGQGEERKRTFTYLDQDFNVRVAKAEGSEYDPTTRPWFIEAKPTRVHKTAPYLFQHLQAPGQTYSRVLPNSSAVIAVDIALSSLSTYLQQQQVSADEEIYLYQETGEVIASNLVDSFEQSMLQVPRLALTPKQQAFIDKKQLFKVSNSQDWSPIDFAISGKPQGYAVDLMSIVSASTGLRFEYTNGYEWSELVTMFERDDLDILQGVFLNKENQRLGQLSSSFLNLPLSVITLKGAENIGRIEQLKGKTLAIAKGWSLSALIKEHYPDINIVEVAQLKDVFDVVRNGKAYAGIDSQLILQQTGKQFFIDDVQYHSRLTLQPMNFSNTLHFLVNEKHPELLELINLALANVKPGLLTQLDEKWQINQSQQTTKKNYSSMVPYQSLISLSAQPELHDQLNRMTINDREYFVYTQSLLGHNEHKDMFAAMVPVESVLGESLKEIQLSILFTGLCLLLMLPFSWLFSSPIVNPIRRLAKQNKLINQREFDQVYHQPTRICEIEELSLSMIEMSNSIQAHERSQQELMDAFIKIIGQAIDDKSRYTGGHCSRIPNLAIELAQAASKDSQGVFKDFSFKDDMEIREFTIAAWLHDCGKITTPEHIVDKGTKLEVIYNRIHEVRMRFEVLWRDAEIEYLKQIRIAPQLEMSLLDQLQRTRERLRDDFSFIAQANVGGEFMSQTDIARLHSFSEITWQRNFDDSLGLSPVEEARLSSKTVSLPVTESLLMDKPDHIVSRTEPMVFPEQFEIKMDVPEHLSNQGELHNLTITRGTLTAEDRFKINEHIISTIKMLEALPLPPELSRVPRYASTHHETLKGTGYPRRLSAEDLSVPERVLAVCDIFEALTAADRPYKKAKPISVAIDILHKMALDEHIDIDVFELLLTSGIYLEYANEYLPPSQIDALDINQYLRSPAEKGQPEQAIAMA
ncbi:transporter substrate-binding domain-containing protein [Psychrobium sp. 1_MG-2023]|nr:HD domain-containing phosphohydrolase [Psychrobium sp. 1_MG-2023]MDP2559574.1 transporter substrate-binding domain-containing protein [Psychrobium sp. 1_MG-2023]PKF59561.1 phosphohydrolase [Alteromonadales bacterium alter-6D02]